MSQAVPGQPGRAHAHDWCLVIVLTEPGCSEISFGSLHVSIGCLTDMSRLHACCARASLAAEERGFLAYELSLAHKGILHSMGHAPTFNQPTGQTLGSYIRRAWPRRIQVTKRALNFRLLQAMY